jgi:hypothetical protein
MSTHILSETVKGAKDSFGVLGMNRILLKWVLKEILWEGGFVWLKIVSAVKIVIGFRVIPNTGTS